MNTNHAFDAKRDSSMKMQKRQFRIGELANQLAIERFVIRFWEKEFEVKTKRSSGGQRCYTQEDVDKFKLIKELLYFRGFTIAGAKQQLKVKAKQGDDAQKVMGSQKTTLDFPEETIEQVSHKILFLQERLKQLRTFLD